MSKLKYAFFILIRNSFVNIIRSALRTRLLVVLHPWLILALKFFHRYVDSTVSASVRQLKLITSNHGGYLYISITNTGVIQVYYTSSIFSIPSGVVSNSAIRSSYENMELIRGAHGKDLVAYNVKLVQNSLGIFTITERLFTPDDLIEASRDVYARLLSLKLDPPISSSILKHVQSSLKLMNHPKDSDISLTLINIAKDFEKLESVPMHGDFTPGNLMATSRGGIVLIDLDRFTFCGFQGFDSLHFFIEHSSLQRKTNWISFLNNMLDSLDSPDFVLIDDIFGRSYSIQFVLLYIMVRLDFEVRDGILSSPFYLLKVDKLLQRLLNRKEMSLSDNWIQSE